MNVLITGGAGFVGSNLAQFLIEQGDNVTVLDNLSSGYVRNLDGLEGVKFVRGDIRDAGCVRTCMAEIECVFHLAASVGNKRSIDNPIRDAEINVIGTLRLLEAAKAAGVRKMVLSSSAGIFGELKTLPIREDHAIEPDSPYGASKLCAEKEALAIGRLNGIEMVCLRYFNVYGVKQRFDAYGNVIPIFIFQALRKEPLTIFGDGEQTRDFVNVRDVVQANFKAAMQRGISGAFNIGSSRRISINDLVERLTISLGFTPDIRFGEPRHGDVRDSLADISAARAAFDYSPSVSLGEGLDEFVTWAKWEMTA